MRFFMLFCYLLLIIVGVSFAALNASSVQLHVYVKTITLPLSVVIALALGIGMLLGFLLFLGRYYRSRVALHKLQHQLRLTEKEIKNLRSIPLQD